MKDNISEKLTNLVREQINANNDSISFADFMQAVLYAPGLGYYVAGKHKFGVAGDFVTAPEISPLFSLCVAKQCQQVLATLDGGDILEFGAGSGLMAASILTFLAERQQLPGYYFILEPSPDLQWLQRQTLQAKCPELVARVHWLCALPAQFTGIMLANEVIDAFPVHIFHWNGQRYLERTVTYNKTAQRFAWQDRHIVTDSELYAALLSLPQDNFVDDYRSEINLYLKPWIYSLNDSLQRGVILLIDYGFSAADYYHPQRNRGTLRCYYQHQAHSDPLVNIGLQDITAHVNFSTAAEAADMVDLKLSGYLNQANFLLNCDILSLYQQSLPSDPLANINAQQQLNKLLQPQEMGELCKCFALMKNLDLPLLGFSQGDRSASL